jgi:hypothetical protein
MPLNADLRLFSSTLCYTAMVHSCRQIIIAGCRRLARDLSAKATASLKRKAPVKLSTPLSGGMRRFSTGLGGTARLTPAARKLATHLRKKAPDTDLQVRSLMALRSHGG